MRAIIFLLVATVFCAIMADADESNLICESETMKLIVKLIFSYFVFSTGPIEFDITFRGVSLDYPMHYKATPNTTVGNLKQQLELLTKTADYNQIIKLGNVVLDNDKLLSFYGINKGSTLNWSKK